MAGCQGPLGCVLPHLHSPKPVGPPVVQSLEVWYACCKLADRLYFGALCARCAWYPHDSAAALGCSVTEKEIVAAIAQQTGRELDARQVSLPEIKTTGSFPATIKLHPDVIGKFQVVVQKEKGTS